MSRAVADRANVDEWLKEQLGVAHIDVASLAHQLASTNRLQFLQHLKQLGVATVGKRQRIANEVSRWMRQQPKFTPVAVVYIHIGARPYLDAAIRTTASVHQPVYVIGDASVQATVVKIPGVTFVPIAAFQNDAEVHRARRCYVHRSSNHAAFEFFCFERIFILRRFLATIGAQRVLHLDSDCVLLVPLALYPLHRHARWLVNNDHYHQHGFSMIPSASVHAAILDEFFCAQFERLFFAIYEGECACLPKHVRDLVSWADSHVKQGGLGGLSDMSLYFLLQSRPASDPWAHATLGWVDDIGDFGAVVESSDASEASVEGVALTWMNNIGTGEGPDGLSQFEVDRRTGAPMLVVRREEDAADGDRRGRLLVYDTIHHRNVQICCTHFSGGQKVRLNLRWLREHWGLQVD